MEEILKKYNLMFFSLDRKEPPHKSIAGQAPDQGCKSLAKYFIRTTEKIKLAVLKQKFSLFVVLIHILDAKYLRPAKEKDER